MVTVGCGGWRDTWREGEIGRITGFAYGRRVGGKALTPYPEGLFIEHDGGGHGDVWAFGQCGRMANTGHALSMGNTPTEGLPWARTGQKTLVWLSTCRAPHGCCEFGGFWMVTKGDEVSGGTLPPPMVVSCSNTCLTLQEECLPCARPALLL